MKLIWRGAWKKGEIEVETENAEELIATLNKLESVELVSPVPTPKMAAAPSEALIETPMISTDKGPSQTVREILGSPWGRAEPRTMKQITSVLEVNAIFFSSSSLSGVLTNMTKKGELKRSKKEDQWAYTLAH